MTKIENHRHVKTFFNTFLDFLFPIDPSVENLQKVTANELVSLLPASEHQSDWVTGLFAYSDERVKHLVWEIKYYKNEKVAKEIGSLLAEKIEVDFAEKIKSGQEEFLVVPIPLTKRRLNERGFNHTTLIARSILQNLPGNFVLADDILKKIRHTPKQSLIEDRQERFRNMENVFEVSELEKVLGKNVLIVDDVTTTGATLEEARRALVSAGVKSVVAYTIAH